MRGDSGGAFGCDVGVGGGVGVALWTTWYWFCGGGSVCEGGGVQMVGFVGVLICGVGQLPARGCHVEDKCCYWCVLCWGVCGGRFWGEGWGRRFEDEVGAGGSSIWVDWKVGGVGWG